LGYIISSSTGKLYAEEFLKKLGASEVIGRNEVNDESGRTLLKEVWGGAIDTVGGNTLVTLLKSCKKGGAVVSAGLVGSSNLPATVFPFVLRGISLQGTGASETTMSVRREIWSKLGAEWKPNNLEHLAVDCKLEQLDPEIDRILVGDQQGRVVVDLQ
jgi:putative YhdH/YhfP family quinone oxidoreductase